MKNKLLILSLLISVSCFSQYTARPSNMQLKTWMNHTPGLELRKASNCFFLGLGLDITGIILISSGEARNANIPSSQAASAPGNGSIGIGSLMLLAGEVYHILAWVHINRAGKLMDFPKKVSFGGTRNGIGLTYNFE